MQIKAQLKHICYRKENKIGGMFYILELAEIENSFEEISPEFIKMQGNKKTIIFKGNFKNPLNEGAGILVDAEISQYKGEDQLTLPKNGKCEMFDIETVESNTILTYLCQIIGLKKAEAKKVLEMYGDDTLKKLYDTSNLIACGFTTTQATEIMNKHIEKTRENMLMQGLSRIGIDRPVEVAMRLSQTYGDDVREVVWNTPYRPYEDGVYTFEESIIIATKRSNIDDIFFGYDCPEFLRAVVMHVFEEIENNGHTCIEDFNCFQYVQKSIVELLKTQMHLYDKPENISNEDFALEMANESQGIVMQTIQELIDEKFITRYKFIDKDDMEQVYFLYRSDVFDAEEFASNMIRGQVHPDDEEIPENVDEMIDDMQAEMGMHYADCQIDAIKAPLTSHCVIVTGGPGTGKTTTLNGMLKFQRILNPKIKILGAAPTGRAAQRMAEATGMACSTVHRLLEVVPENGELVFRHNQQNPLDCDIVVIDEFSMVDMLLFGSLMRAIKPTTKVIFVGDSNQLPSVGAGSVLRDMIDSKIVPTIELQIVFRQDSSSNIAINADLIKQNRPRELRLDKEGNFHIIRTRDEDGDEVIKRKTLDLFKFYLDKYTADGMEDAIYQVQILTPVRKDTYALSSAGLNPTLRDMANPRNSSKKEYRTSKGECIFREGDKIMQKKNNYEKDVYNGDLGLIQSIDNVSKEIVVKFQFKEDMVTYKFADAREIDLAYATTIHKSQGSEYACTIIPISPSYNGAGFNSKNLLYTGITRAKKVFYFIGSERAIMYGLKNTQTTNRCTTLRNRINNEEVVDDIAGKELLGLIPKQELE